MERRKTVTVYKFMDASGAISAYDYFKKPGMRPEKLGDDAISNGDELLLRSGVNVVRADFKNHGVRWHGSAKELIVGLPKVGGPAALAPLLPTLLPAKGLDAESVRYALGPDGYAAMGGVLPAAGGGLRQECGDGDGEVQERRRVDAAAVSDAGDRGRVMGARSRRRCSNRRALRRAR